MIKMRVTFLFILSILWMSSHTSSAEDAPAPDNDPLSADANAPRWRMSIIAGGFSKHLTTQYEPEGGYTEQHSNRGLEIGQAGPGWVFSAQATWFNDSHDEISFLGVGAFGYRAVLPYTFSIYGGIGAGYAGTSYYNGLIALPFAELGWWRISAQGSYLPELSNSDSGIAVQFKARIFDW
jgi:hypothetical protein